MIDESKFPEYREKVFQYIQEEILPKYPEIKSCKMHVLPPFVNRDVEYILELSEFLTIIEQDSLKDKINIELKEVCNSFEEDFFSEILIILWYQY